ncbi:winged helix-turn-helix transcriptional regulator [Candidatus Saccharibacteria bacterium]|nr:winged helix-turn-helix transcriptional regulator [Candidatus Saccharibacteria bacterium]
MVEYTSRIDIIFSALADPVRRDMIERTADVELTVNQIAVDYDMSLAAVSKHLKVLFEAGLIDRRKDGRYHFISMRKDGMRDVVAYMQQYENAWSERLEQNNEKK